MRIFRIATVVAGFMLATPCLHAQPGYDYDDDPITEAVDGSDNEVDSLMLAISDTVMSAATVITPAELDSPMMNIIEVSEVTPTLADNVIMWVLDHLFISTLVGNLLIAGFFWLVYRVYSYLT